MGEWLELAINTPIHVLVSIVATIETSIRVNKKARKAMLYGP